MNDNQQKTMRDVFIEQIYNKMFDNNRIFFLSADFGSPVLDKLRQKFSDRFINVGIAEQNLINIAAGLGLEGFTVYAYAISPFLTMRAYEQSRNNLSLLSQTKEINVNLVGVGAGLSYDVSGPTHHCLEDISLMRLLPNFIVFSPSDWVIAEKFIDTTINIKKPKYIRFDAKPLVSIYTMIKNQEFERGFCQLRQGKEVCLVSTGYMTHTALMVAEKLLENKIKCGALDIFLLKPLAEDLIFEILKKYKCIITLEEGFINKGGLDTAISNILTNNGSNILLKRLGFADRYVFELGGRDCLHRLNGLDVDSIVKVVKDCLRRLFGGRI